MKIYEGLFIEPLKTEGYNLQQYQKIWDMDFCEFQCEHIRVCCGCYAFFMSTG